RSAHSSALEVAVLSSMMASVMTPLCSASRAVGKRGSSDAYDRIDMPIIFITGYGGGGSPSLETGSHPHVRPRSTGPLQTGNPGIGKDLLPMLLPMSLRTSGNIVRADLDTVLRKLVIMFRTRNLSSRPGE